MCFTYMYHCRQCNNLVRNYRRWPLFCEKLTCDKMRHPIMWTCEIPCTGCEPVDCGIIVSQTKKELCGPCHLKKSWESCFGKNNSAQKKDPAVQEPDTLMLQPSVEQTE